MGIEGAPFTELCAVRIITVASLCLHPNRARLEYYHCELVHDENGNRLAKRHAASERFQIKNNLRLCRRQNEAPSR